MYVHKGKGYAIKSEDKVGGKGEGEGDRWPCNRRDCSSLKSPILIPVPDEWSIGLLLEPVDGDDVSGPPTVVTDTAPLRFVRYFFVLEFVGDQVERGGHIELELG